MAKSSTATKQDVYERITAAIVAELEKGVLPWRKPWTSGCSGTPVVRLPRRANGERYRGVNVLMLWAAAAAKGYASPFWMTYKQATTLGGQVRKGEKGEMVVYANVIEKKVTAEDGSEEERRIPFMKGYTVFNAEQIDGLPEKFYVVEAEPETPAESETRDKKRVERAEEFFKNTGMNVHHGGDRAFYNLFTDHVQMPEFEDFRDEVGYYSTLAHEGVHWTGHTTRLDREFGTFGTEPYAREELVAELGAAFLCADLDLVPETRPDHAAYIGSWLKILKDDKKAIFKAATKAQAAADFLHERQEVVASREAA